MFDYRVFHSERQHRDAINSPLNHAPHRQLHSLWIVNGRAQQHFVIVTECVVLKTFDDFWEEWIGDLRNY